MKPGRNEQCPCGSGKKYKKCCYLSEHGAPDDEEAKSGDLPDDNDDRDYGEFVLTAINGLRRIVLDKKPHIKEYYRIRKMHGEVVDSMINYNESGKFQLNYDANRIPQGKPDDDPESALFLIESEFDIETREGIQALYDILIYKAFPALNCITEDFIHSHRFRIPEKIELLHDMLESKLGLFEVKNTEPNEGYAYLKEVFSGDEYRITDIGLSGDRHYDDFYFYTRIITHRGISFGTGLNLIFTKTDDFVRNHIQHYAKGYTPDGELVRLVQLYNRFSKDPDKVRVFSSNY